jgi:succinate-semialdehyde dehydrogenase / glutarate-semialdehyde dehydrogenase
LDEDMSRSISARNPRTGALDYTFPAFETAEVSATASAVRAGQTAWAALTVERRCDRLRKFAEALRTHATTIAGALEIDTGRRRIARMEIEGVAVSILGWIAQAPHLTPSGWTEGRGNKAIRHAPQFAPYQLVGVISPWNFPVTLSMIDTIPALLAGCSVVIKPSEVTPRFVAPLLVAIEDAGIGDVLAIITGDGATGAALIDVVDAICFTGSVATGRKVAMAAAARMIPAFLELGGKDPLIVTESADLDRATDAALRGSVLSTGQACQSIERIYVQRSIHDAFIGKLVAKAEAARLNWPEIDAGEIGPIIFDKQAATLESHIRDAREKGARVLTGGEIEHLGGGLWLRPTVIAEATHDMRVVTEETFGPIMPVMAFDTTDEAIALANRTEYGLSAAVFAGTLEEAEAIGRLIDAGAVSLNDAALTALFHEAEKHSFKLSGLGGSRMGPAGFQRFLRRKALIANTGAPVPLSAFAEDAP